MSRHLLLASAAVLIAAPALAADPEMLVFDWAGFEVPGLAQAYKDKHGDFPTYSFYGNDDEAFQKVATGFRADVAHPCSQMVSKYRDAGLIEPWDTAKIPHFADIDPKFLESPVFKDDGGVWFVPTDWGAVGIAYNKDEVPVEDVASLQVFTDAKYQGRTSLPNSGDDVWALAYLATGVTDWTNVSEDQFNAAADWLRKAHQNVRSYWADPSEQAQLMASGEVLVAWSWNDGVTYLQADNFPVGFQREAKEGSSTFLCGYVNLKGGPGSEDKAHDFMDSWLRPESGQALIDAIGYGHTSDKAMALIDPKQIETAGLTDISAPILQQLPNDPALRERQLAEFEKIKAGF